MHWLRDLFLITPQSSAAAVSAHTLLVFGAIAIFGRLIGRIKIAGLSLGIAGVLFVAILLGNYHVSVPAPILNFTRDFGYILFAYTIGVQIGPGFGASLRQNGLRLNALAAAIVALGLATTAILGRTVLRHHAFAEAVGVFSGATTNTPSLQAALQAIVGIGQVHHAKYVETGYAVAYPFGILGIIFSMFVVRWLFRINLKQEAADLDVEQGTTSKKLAAMSVHVTNDKLDGLSLNKMLGLIRRTVVISRVYRGDTHQVANADIIIHRGDVLQTVGTPDEVESFRELVGEEYHTDLTRIPSDLTSRNSLVTTRALIGCTVSDLDLTQHYNVAATRITRGEIELSPSSNVKIMFGDRIKIVGEESDVAAAAAYLGDSAQKRDQPMVITMFVAIVVGIIIGSIPVSIPGFPVPMTLGIAGGPLVSAIVFSRIGKIGRWVWYMPRSANLMVREIGIVLFLTGVGLHAGVGFGDKLVHGDGLELIGCGILITVIPLLATTILARAFLKMNYMTLCGLMAGAMTDSPALAFAGQATNSDAPSVSYAAVYPLVLLMRIVATQAMVLFFCR